MPKKTSAAARGPDWEGTVADEFRLRNNEATTRAENSRIHVLGRGIICDTDARGQATPQGASPLEIVVDATQGFVPLWAHGTTLRWRFREQSMANFADPLAARAGIRKLLGEAILAWGDAAPIRFTEDTDLWDFEIVMRGSDSCSSAGCVLASAFFPDPGRHKLVLYPKMFEQRREEQLETLIHELGHVFGLRHFFADISETAWPSLIYGAHRKFTIMNYGSLSSLTDHDRLDLRTLYQEAWRGALTHINGTPIRFVRPYHELATIETLHARQLPAGMTLWPAVPQSVITGMPAVGGDVSAVATAVATLPVTVVASVGSGGKLGAKLNERTLRFQNGTAHALVRAGQRNTLSWVVVGAAGTPWSLKVTEPASADCEAGGTLDENRQATGFCHFDS